jgi:hypothetical protein
MWGTRELSNPTLAANYASRWGTQICGRIPHLNVEMWGTQCFVLHFDANLVIVA